MFLFFVLVACTALFVGDEGGDTSDSDDSETDTGDNSDTTDDPVDSQPETQVVEEEVAPEPEVPKEWQNALNQADSYANRMNMSYQGVYDQLTSEYGGQFGADAAQYAVDNVQTDWFANALAKGQSYYDNMSMSKQNVYDQLVSQYGEQFTAEQAQYAYDNLN